MATRNVYLPDALTAEMDAIEGVNWSQVAQDAFREAIIRRKSMTGSTEAVVERLRLTAGKQGGAYQDAHAEGRAWAEQEADADELEALCGVNLEDYLRKANDDAARAAQWIFGDEFGYDNVEELMGGRRITENRLKGFVDGALEVWGEVRPNL